MSLGGLGWLTIDTMVINLKLSNIKTISEVKSFLAGASDVTVAASGDAEERYQFIAMMLKQLCYRTLKREEKGVVLRFLQHSSGFSRAQVTRLVSRWVKGQPLRRQYRPPEHAFKRRYTEADIASLIEADRAFDTLSGPATIHAMRREYVEHGDVRYERLATLSPAHLYNLRRGRQYRSNRLTQTKTRPILSHIGTRKAPCPEGRPGYIRIDSVHQGDHDGVKGVYHINAVDMLTQWQIVATVERISENHLIPILEQMIDQFPFEIKGFHSDNGSEYINKKVSNMLEKMRIEQTKSRPRKTNDNALVEGKNGAVVRNIYGFSHIPQHHAKMINSFNKEVVNPFINFHRPCFFVQESINEKGKVIKKYPRDLIKTPFEKLASIEQIELYLKPGITIESLQKTAKELSGIEAGKLLQQKRVKLFASFGRQPARAA